MENRTQFNLATWHWHIEISSKCTLKCPRCARQEVPDTLNNSELTLDFFKTNFTPEFILSHVEKITFCGNDGDPIYAKDLIEVIRYFKSIKPVEIVIVTNGSYKKAEWWKELGSVLTDIDEVHFSLDGWDQKSNEKYRVNSDWNSIIAGLVALRRNSNVFITWAAIVFEFNERQFGLIEFLARNAGCDTLQITKSTKFNKFNNMYPAKDTLQPSAEFIGDGGRFNRTIKSLSNRTRIAKSVETNIQLYKSAIEIFKDKEVIPLCSIGNKGLYISAQGRLYPCCWVANRYEHNKEWNELSIDLNLETLQDTISNANWLNRFSNFTGQECKAKCSCRAINQAYATEW